MYRFLLTRRWVLAHLLIILVVFGFIELGFWQLRRLHERRTYNALREERMHMSLVPVGTLSSLSPREMTFRRVVASGTFDVNEEVVLLSRSNGDVPGNQLLTPLRVPGSPAVIVDRGAVPLELDRPKAPEAFPPSGTVSVTGILLPSERRGTFGTRLAPGHLATIARIDLPRLRAQLPYPAYPLYLLLQTQQPPQRGKYPVPVSLRPLDEGPHLGYAIQWFLFSGIAVVTYGALIRRSARAGRIA